MQACSVSIGHRCQTTDSKQHVQEPLTDSPGAWVASSAGVHMNTKMYIADSKHDWMTPSSSTFSLDIINRHAAEKLLHTAAATAHKDQSETTHDCASTHRCKAANNKVTESIQPFTPQ